jgi:hypothetical protein
MVSKSLPRTEPAGDNPKEVLSKLLDAGYAQDISDTIAESISHPPLTPEEAALLVDCERQAFNAVFENILKKSFG